MAGRVALRGRRWCSSVALPRTAPRGSRSSSLADEFTIVACDEPGRAAPRMCPPASARGLRGLHRAPIEAGARLPPVLGGSPLLQDLYRHHPALVAILILIDAYAGWKGRYPRRSYVPGSGAVQMPAAPAKHFDPILPVPVGGPVT
jgi:hypothetical protein